jgi:hypothetical protein
MSDATTPPERIKPLYESPESDQEISLIEVDEVTLRQGVNEAVGRLKVTQAWSPMRLIWEFVGNKLDRFDFGEIELLSKSFTISGQLFSRSKRRLHGYIEGKIEIGSDHELDRVIFHLSDYPDFMGCDDFCDEITNGAKKTSIRWAQVVIEAGVWRVTLHPYQDIHAIKENGRQTQKVALCGVGEIRRVDGTEFKKDEVSPLLQALRIFLSFSFANWSPPLLVVGFSKSNEAKMHEFLNYDLSPKPYLQGWLDEHHGRFLADAFPHFMNVWAKSTWQEPLELAVTWLIEASRQAGGTEGAIAFAQIPLEMLSWLVFVDDSKNFAPKQFENLSAAKKLEMLLTHCGIPIEIPAELTALNLIATALQKSGEITSGPQLVTKVRNTIIHPNDKNRRILSKWAVSYSVKIIDIRWETLRLFKWYITLVLLRLTGYSGDYANRIKVRTVGEVEAVPWAVR